MSIHQLLVQFIKYHKENDGVVGDLLKLDHKSQISKQQSKLDLAFIFWLFVVGSILGFFMEGILVVLQKGHWENHASLIWGPFCTIYGIGAVIAYLLGLVFSKKNLVIQFFIYMFAITLLEYIASYFQQLFFGTIAWDYKNHALNINGRVSVSMSIAWGMLCIIVVKLLIPLFEYCYELIRGRMLLVITWIFLIFFLINSAVTSIAVTRWGERRKNLPPQNGIERYLDQEYDDITMKRIFQNTRFINK